MFDFTAWLVGMVGFISGIIFLGLVISDHMKKNIEKDDDSSR